ncbi:hypothetical protein ACFVWR_12270 [Leifsonia sp. NPDC058292]|uniref:hypothetical protein n=1 Tax=Leifsonia sp. NPDC058292 TaxID=3346428 RepID=UPI0036D9B04C
MLVLFVVFAVFSALMIWRMETLRRNAIDISDIHGRVAGKRIAPEQGTIGAGEIGAISLLPMHVIPESRILRIDTARGERNVVVDAETFAGYEVGDAFP